MWGNQTARGSAILPAFVSPTSDKRHSVNFEGRGWINFLNMISQAANGILRSKALVPQTVPIFGVACQL